MNVHDITGLSLILLGFLVKRFPDLIAGYNTMSVEQKAKVDIVGLSSHMRNSMIVMGLSLIVFSRLYQVFDLPINRVIGVMAIILLGTLYMVIRAQSFTNKVEGRKSSKKPILITVIILITTTVLVVILIAYGSRSTEFSVQGNQLEINGMYGMTTTIQKVEQIEALPPILMKTNGFAMGATKKGNFKLEGLGKCKLYLESSTGPFIYLETTDATKVFINTKSNTETEKLFDKLKKISK